MLGPSQNYIQLHMTAPCSPNTQDALYRSLFAEYGPLIGDEMLWRALGFKTWAGFDKSIKAGNVGVRVFRLPGRRGRYALTQDVAEWLWQARETCEVPLHEQEGRPTESQ